jgi:hypothetical protein
MTDSPRSCVVFAALGFATEARPCGNLQFFGSRTSGALTLFLSQGEEETVPPLLTLSEVQRSRFTVRRVGPVAASCARSFDRRTAGKKTHSRGATSFA